ncbi:MAG: lipocalin-like domain-containing protein [Okeania sp. SIO2C9]|uniref:lipocalin-like domain-containing protein n=1 Tax=Okeania sp. SIO2C9 TaxID=2607791 RepID=UPI0013C10600|nr:lipocalin-like domain-containing protein [Okeania sp. SIO2C9]NEQ77699.1 lipocalin-like domain-containing protein [Okeania sp. SIO2C9]
MDFVGTWKLVEVSSDKNVYPWGEHPEGYLIYTADGYMSASIMRSDRCQLGLSLEEMQELSKGGIRTLVKNLFGYIKGILRYFQAAKGYTAYTGSYEIQDNKVIHHVKVSLIPDWVGTVQERTFKFLGDKLILTAPPVGDVSYVLTWQRVN